MEAELDHPAYLYRYGLYIGKDETESAHFLHSLTKQQMQAMADTFTEGYRIGFETTGKDISKKSVVEIRYPLGFERMVRAAVHNFKRSDCSRCCVRTLFPEQAVYLRSQRGPRAVAG